MAVLATVWRRKPGGYPDIAGSAVRAVECGVTRQRRPEIGAYQGVRSLTPRSCAPFGVAGPDKRPKTARTVDPTFIGGRRAGDGAVSQTCRVDYHAPSQPSPQWPHNGFCVVTPATVRARLLARGCRQGANHAVCASTAIRATLVPLPPSPSGFISVVSSRRAISGMRSRLSDQMA